MPERRGGLVLVEPFNIVHGVIRHEDLVRPSVACRGPSEPFRIDSCLEGFLMIVILTYRRGLASALLGMNLAF